MKRFFAVVMAILLGATLFALAGCSSGDTAKAQQYTQTADAAFAPINEQLNSLQTQSNTLITQFMSGQSPAVASEQIATARTAMDNLIKQLETVKAQYAKVTTLSGVPDYVAYAKAMQKAIDADIAVINAAAALLQKLLPAIQAGDVNALNAAIQQNMGEITAVQTQVNNAEKALNQAQQIKSSKNLK